MASKTASAVKKGYESIEIMQIDRGFFEVCVLGTSPFICNAMSAKARQQLLFPPRKKNTAERASTLKHDIDEEFATSPYLLDSGPTLIGHMATAFKGAMRNAALDIPGATKSQIGRLTFIQGDYVPLYGIPKFFMAVVHQGGFPPTPDIRTRAILPQWACKFTVSYVKPLIKSSSVINLIGASGVIQGVGDWRPEKGSGSYGQFNIVDPDDKEFLRVVSQGGREAQIKAMASPLDYDAETARLRKWYYEEVLRREMKPVQVSAPKTRSTKGNGKSDRPEQRI